MSSSPFYALHEIFAFYIASENQFCNYLFTRLKIDTDQCTRQPVAMQRALKVLGLHKTILQAHIGQLTNMIKLLRNKETAPWVRLESAENIGMLPQVQPHLSRQNSGVHERPSQPTDPRKDATLERAASDLLVDYEEVLQRETTLLQSYDNSMNEIRNLAMLLEAQRGIEQAEGVARLTLLAFLFIPLSFTSSFFGMNFKEFVGDGLSLWVWFAVSIPIFLVSLGVCFADKLQQTWRITIGVRLFL
jgi:Mg2+ and Co2+ transporter CorA